MNSNLLGGCEIPMKIDKSRLLFLSGDLDDMEVDPGIHSPSPGERSPVKLEMMLSEAHSVKYRRSTLSPEPDEISPMQAQLYKALLNSSEQKTEEVKLEELKV